MDPLPPKNRHVIMEIAPFMNDAATPKGQRLMVRRMVRYFIVRRITKRRKP
jgi:hypothetical protein